MSTFQKMCDALHRKPINPQAILDATTVPAKDEWSEEARKAAAEARSKPNKLDEPGKRHEAGVTTRRETREKEQRTMEKQNKELTKAGILKPTN